MDTNTHECKKEKNISVYSCSLVVQKIALSLAYKRFSQAEKEAIVAEGFQATGWLDLSNLTEIQMVKNSIEKIKADL